MIQVIKDYFYMLGNVLGIDTFLKKIGPWGTLGLSITIGVLYLAAVYLILKTFLKIENTAEKIILTVIAIAVLGFIGYIYVDGCIGIITRLGGLL